MDLAKPKTEHQLVNFNWPSLFEPESRGVHLTFLN